MDELEKAIFEELKGAVSFQDFFNKIINKVPESMRIRELLLEFEKAEE